MAEYNVLTRSLVNQSQLELREESMQTEHPGMHTANFGVGGGSQASLEGVDAGHSTETAINSTYMKYSLDHPGFLVTFQK